MAHRREEARLGLARRFGAPTLRDVAADRVILDGLAEAVADGDHRPGDPAVGAAHAHRLIEAAGTVARRQALAREIEPRADQRLRRPIRGLGIGGVDHSNRPGEIAADDEVVLQFEELALLLERLGEGENLVGERLGLRLGLLQAVLEAPLLAHQSGGEGQRQRGGADRQQHQVWGTIREQARNPRIEGRSMSVIR